MRKHKIIATIVMIAAMSIMMCGMMFGFTFKESFLEGALVISGSEVREYSKSFKPKEDDTPGDTSPKIVENQPMQPYFESIASAGKYVVGVYTKSGNTWTEFDSDQKSAFVRTSSGFYTNLCNYAGGKDNYPFIRGSNGIKMQLDYLQVRYD